MGRKIIAVSVAFLATAAIALGTWQIISVRNDLSATKTQLEAALNGHSKSGLVANQIVESVVVAKLQQEMATEVTLMTSMESQISADGNTANNALALSQGLDSSISTITQNVSDFNMFIGCIRNSGGSPYSISNC